MSLPSPLQGLAAVGRYLAVRGFLRVQNRWNVLRAVYRNPGLHVAGHVEFVTNDLTRFRAEPGAMIMDYAHLTVWGPDAFSPVPGRLSLGRNVLVGMHASIIAAGGEVSIGDHSMLAQRVSLIAANHSVVPGEIYRSLPLDGKKCGVRIESNVWLGCHVVVLPGCVIGRNSVVAAGSVVTGDIPPDEIWGGVPARFLRAIRSPGDRAEALAPTAGR